MEPGPCRLTERLLLNRWGVLLCTGLALWCLQITGAEDYPNWVVVTTLESDPTPAIRKLAAVPGWKVVVVATGDVRALNWTMEGVEFLDRLKMKLLGNKLLEKIPPGNQGLRMMGYLYAIKNGADTIYDATEDTMPVRGEIPALASPSVVSTYVPEAPSLAINVYRTFGPMYTWPFGFPLEALREPPPSAFRRTGIKPLIQHSLAQKVMPTDAFSELTGASGVVGDINYNSHPVALPQGSFCPYDVERTLYTYDALWALGFPLSVSAKIGQALRSYMAQRLLWDIGGLTTFLPPAPPVVGAFARVVGTAAALPVEAAQEEEDAEQVTAADLAAELPFHMGVGKLLRKLADAKFKGNTLDQRLLSAVGILVEQKYLNASDVAVFELWVKELTKLNYRWPAIAPVREAPIARPEVKDPSGGVDIFPRQYRRLNNIILIVMYNHPQEAYLVRLLDKLYRPIFGQVVHTGYVALAKHGPRELDGIIFEDCHQSRAKQGWFMQECFGRVMHRYVAPPDGGYFIIADDTLIDPCAIASFPRNKVWSWHVNMAPYPETGLVATNWTNWSKEFDGERTLEEAMLRAAHALKDTSQILSFNASQMYILNINGTLGRHWETNIADVLYIPSCLRPEFIALSMHFTRERVYAEVALGHIVGILTNGSSPELLQPLVGQSLWFAARDNRTNWKLGPKGMLDGNVYTHGIKLTQYGLVVAEWWTDVECPLEKSSVEPDWMMQAI